MQNTFPSNGDNVNQPQVPPPIANQGRPEPTASPGKVVAPPGIVVISGMFLCLILQLAGLWLFCRLAFFPPHAELKIIDSIIYLQAVSVALLISGVFTYFIYLTWVYFAYKNLFLMRSRQKRFSAIGAVCWHFCPVANVAIAWMVLNDLWQGRPGGYRRPPAARIPAMMILGVVLLALSVARLFIDYPDMAALLTLLQMILSPIALSLFISIVYAITKNQDKVGKEARRSQARATTPIIG